MLIHYFKNIFKKQNHEFDQVYINGTYHADYRKVYSSLALVNEIICTHRFRIHLMRCLGYCLSNYIWDPQKVCNLFISLRMWWYLNRFFSWKIFKSKKVFIPLIFILIIHLSIILFSSPPCSIRIISYIRKMFHHTFFLQINRNK